MYHLGIITEDEHLMMTKSEFDAVYCSPYYYIKMNDARGFMHQLAGFGHHQVLIFGDYTKMIHLIGEVMGFKVMEHK